MDLPDRGFCRAAAPVNVNVITSVFVLHNVHAGAHADFIFPGSREIHLADKVLQGLRFDFLNFRNDRAVRALCLFDDFFRGHLIRFPAAARSQ